MAIDVSTVADQRIRRALIELDKRTDESVKLSEDLTLKLAAVEDAISAIDGRVVDLEEAP